MQVVWTLCPIGSVCLVLRRHIWLCLVCQKTLANTVFCPDTCNQATLPPMYPDSNLNTIAHHNLLLLLSILPALSEAQSRGEDGVFLAKENIVSACTL